ncbi:MAG TPA: glycogen/starch synthase [Geobacteraceae bacterium]|nr:glycogen/starch synthase [Geobacteraceae bacterium]
MSLSVLITASEAVPFIKSGGLADVVGVLPKYLRRLGHDVRLVLPRYYGIDKKKFGLKLLPGVLVVPMGTAENEYCAVYEGRLPDSDIPAYFLEHEGYFGRSGMYAENNVEFTDNDRRFIFFSKGSLELCKMLDFYPDLVHVNDWHTAAIPLLLNTTYRQDSHVGKAASLLTLHNMQYQGSFPPAAMDLLGVGWEHFTFLGVEKDNRVNLLKGGIYNATLLNTVSEGYAEEIQTPAQGWGLEGVMKERGNDLFGILNGVDYTEWSPESDPYIAANYSAGNLGGKLACKSDVQKEMGLPQRDDVPLIGMVGRMVKQKGIDVFAEALPRLLELELQIVMLGEGEPWAHFYFGGMAASHRNKLSVCVGYDNGLSHRIEAGADFFLMPSAFEPCGLNQMYSLRYGTIPIVRAVGGLEDSVDNFDEVLLTGTGFKFRDLTAGALFDTVGWALHTWYNRRDAIDKLRQSAMSVRFTWESAAEKYDHLYRMAVKRRSGVSADTPPPVTR